MICLFQGMMPINDLLTILILIFLVILIAGFDKTLVCALVRGKKEPPEGIENFRNNTADIDPLRSFFCIFPVNSFLFRIIGKYISVLPGTFARNEKPAGFIKTDPFRLSEKFFCSGEPHQ
jgi:hypothetical protein